MKNLQTTKMGIFQSFLQKLYMKKQEQEAENIIRDMSMYKEYQVFTLDAFKFYANLLMKKVNTGCVFMGDLNDLDTANKMLGKEKVNIYIQEVINNIKDYLEQSKCSDYIMGKGGDEIFIYAPNMSIEQANEAVEYFQSIKKGMLSISFGVTDYLKEGLGTAADIAEQQMSYHKQKHKRDRFREKCGSNIQRMSEAMVKKILKQVRIDVQQMKQEHRKDLRGNFNTILASIKTDRIKVAVEAAVGINTKKKEPGRRYKGNNSLLQRIEHLTNEVSAKYPQQMLTPDFLNKTILAKILLEHQIPGVVKSTTYLREKRYKKIEKEINNLQLLSIELGNMKFINDTMGHNVCDEEAWKVINYLNLLKQKGINFKSDIISRDGGISSYFLLVEKDSEKIIEALSAFPTRLTVNCAYQDLGKIELEPKEAKHPFKAKLYRGLHKNEQIINEINMAKKVSNTIALEAYITDVMTTLYGIPCVREYLGKYATNEHRELQILGMVLKNSLKDIIKESEPECKKKGKSPIKEERE